MRRTQVRVSCIRTNSWLCLRYASANAAICAHCPAGKRPVLRSRRYDGCRTILLLSEESGQNLAFSFCYRVSLSKQTTNIPAPRLPSLSLVVSYVADPVPPRVSSGGGPYGGDRGGLHRSAPHPGQGRPQQNSHPRTQHHSTLRTGKGGES